MTILLKEKQEKVNPFHVVQHWLLDNFKFIYENFHKNNPNMITAKSDYFFV